jgi:hypothetical protein
MKILLILIQLAMFILICIQYKISAKRKSDRVKAELRK